MMKTEGQSRCDKRELTLQSQPSVSTCCFLLPLSLPTSALFLLPLSLPASALSYR